MQIEEAAAAMYGWLRSNNIPVEGVRLVLSFPDAESKARAEMVIAREMQAMMRWAGQYQPDLKQFEMHGMDMRLESRRDR
jgi:hypothetical protein